MRTIEKRESPLIFENWKSERLNPTYKDLIGEPKRVLKHSLLHDQHYICCYCERTIDESNSHVEHYKPKEIYPNLSLDWLNLFACCRIQPIINEEKTCGHKKANVDPIETISPLDKNPQLFFEFTLLGEIKPVFNCLKSKNTIDLLGLNTPILIQERKAVIDVVFDLDNSLSDQERESYLLQYLLPSNDRYNSFISCISYLYVSNL